MSRVAQCAALTLWATSAQAEAALGLRARIDPIVTLVAGGASVGVDIIPSFTDWRLSLAAFTCEVPRFLVPLVVDASPSLKITESALQLGLFRSSGRGHTGFFFGPELYGYRLGYADDEAPRHHAVSWELYAHATFGGTWFPFADDVTAGLLRRFYLMPWLTAGLPLFHTGGARFSDGVVIDDRVLNWHATVSLGATLF
jgi:hypothetical protein